MLESSAGDTVGIFSEPLIKQPQLMRGSMISSAYLTRTNSVGVLMTPLHYPRHFIFTSITFLFFTDYIVNRG